MTEEFCCPPSNELEHPQDEQTSLEVFSKLSKALGHPARVSILRLLLRRTSCVCGEIVSELPLAQSTVSQHLKILKEAGWIRGEIEGPRVCYCIEPNALKMYQRLLDELLLDILND